MSLVDRQAADLCFYRLMRSPTLTRTELYQTVSLITVENYAENNTATTHILSSEGLIMTLEPKKNKQTKHNPTQCITKKII